MDRVLLRLPAEAARARRQPLHPALYSLETGSEGGLRLSYTMAPPEQDEPAVSPTAERLRRRKER